MNNKTKENKNFYDAWWYLFNHRIFRNNFDVSCFQNCVDICVVKVNPKNNTIDDKNELNIKNQVWLETGEYNQQHKIHDIELDCGGDTYEEAIIELAELVKYNYGNLK